MILGFKYQILSVRFQIHLFQPFFIRRVSSITCQKEAHEKNVSKRVYDFSSLRGLSDCMFLQSGLGGRSNTHARTSDYVSCRFRLNRTGGYCKKKQKITGLTGLED